MAKSISFHLGGEFFAKKGDLENRIQAMVSDYPLMHYVRDSDAALCLNLFRHHPKYREKMGVGIEFIQIRLDLYGNRYFHLIRTDGTDEEISWRKCLAAIKSL